MRKTLRPQRSVPKQSDIVIKPDGEVAVSFLWDDLHTPDFNPPETFIKTNLPKIETKFEIHTNLEYAKCMMCPKECGFNRIKASHPRCGSEKLRIGTWGRTYGDEPEIVGKGGSGAVLLSHCPMSCPSCHNPEMVSSGTEVSLNQVIEICYQLYEEGAENIQFLSPTVHMPKLELLLRTLKSARFPIPIVFKSSGNENINYLKRLQGLVDIYLPDFKYGVNSDFAKRAGSPNYFVEAQKTIVEMISQTGSPQSDSNGILKKGTLVRHVKAPIPESERSSIFEFLKKFEDQFLLSVTDNFVNLE